MLPIEYAKPPRFEEIQDIFHFDPDYTLFAWGDRVYNPGGKVRADEITSDVVVHERIHLEQQGHDYIKANEWWDKFITDPQFRLDQELEAYRAQYQYLCTIFKDRNKRNQIVTLMAKALASPMYGSITSFQDAYRLIHSTVPQGT